MSAQRPLRCGGARITPEQAIELIVTIPQELEEKLKARALSASLEDDPLDVLAEVLQDHLLEVDRLRLTQRVPLS